MRFTFIVSICLITFLIGCANIAPRYDYKTASKYCFDQAEVDKRARKRDWFTQWVTCNYNLIMPIEIFAFPSKEDDIKKMYEKIFILALDVDAGYAPVQEVYAEWDRMQREITRGDCLIKVVGSDGSEECHLRGVIK